VTFVDVGHGTAIIMRFPNHQTMLYDVGSMAGGEVAGQQVAAVLRDSGISHLDGIVLSHADVDHFNGLPIIARQFSIGCVYVEPSMLESHASELVVIRNQLGALNVPLAPIYRGQVCHLTCVTDGAEPIQIRALHPGPGLKSGPDNQRSVVLRLQAFGHTMLLTGDIEGVALRRFLAEDATPCDLLMAPHHGSGTTPIRSVVECFRPQVVLISGAAHRRSVEVARRYRQDGAEIFQTASGGAIQIRIAQSGWSIRTYLADTPPL
jgi:competence protein ComEC